MIRQLVATTALVVSLVLSGAVSGQEAEGKKKDWDELVKAAQREGEVNVILYGGLGLHKGPVQEFEKKYGIKVNYQAGSSRQIAERILAERRMGRYTADAWIGGANTALAQLLPNGVLTPIDELLVHPEVKDESKWFKGKHHYTDPEGRYIFTWGANPQNVVFVNTDLVKPEEIRSYADLLDPKWKGKIVSMSPDAQGVAAASVPLVINEKIGYEWFRRWANEIKPVIVSDARQGAEWVAMGRYPIGMFGLGRPIDKMAEQGFPVQGYLPHPMKEGEVLTAGSANMMAIDRAPNPNAMKLFLNWALTKEGQRAFMERARMDSLRRDIDNSVIEPQYRIQQGVDYYIPFADPEYVNRQKEILSTLSKTMKEAGYK